MWEIAGDLSLSRVSVASDRRWLIRSETPPLKSWHFPGDICTPTVFYVLRSGGSGPSALKDHLSTLCSLSRWQVLNLGQVSITCSHTWHSHILLPINQTRWWEIRKRRRSGERSLWAISTIDTGALQHGPVICCGGQTYCEHIMQRTSHPWPFSYTSLGFSVMYSLASMCAWWCIHCPSSVGPGCQFYHFIFTSIIKLLYWIRQHRKFILFSPPCIIISFSHALSCINRDSPTPHCECSSSIAGPWHHWRVYATLLKRFTRAKMDVNHLMWWAGAMWKQSVQTLFYPCTAMHKELYSCTGPVFLFRPWADVLVRGCSCLTCRVVRPQITDIY